MWKIFINAMLEAVQMTDPAAVAAALLKRFHGSRMVYTPPVLPLSVWVWLIYIKRSVIRCTVA